MSSRLKWIWFFLILLHIGYALVAPKIDPFLRRDPLHGDAVHFDSIAWSLAQGGDFDLNLHRAPLFPLMAAMVYKVVGHVPLLIRVINGCLVTLGAVFMAPFVRRRFGEKVLEWFLILYAIHPLMIHISGWLYTEPLMIALMGALTWVYYEARQRQYSLKYVVGIGILLGFIALTRSNGIFYGALFCLWMAFDTTKPKLSVFAVSVIMMLLVISPWTYRNWNRFHHIVPVSSGGKHLWASNNDLTDGRVLEEDSMLPNGVLDGREVVLSQELRGKNLVEQDAVYNKIGVQWIKSHPIQFLNLLPRKLYFTLTPISYSPTTQRKVEAPIWLHAVADILFGLFFAVSLYGTALVWRTTWKDTAPWWTMLPILLGSVLVFNGSSRYILPMAPAMCIGFACAVGRKSLELNTTDPELEKEEGFLHTHTKTILIEKLSPAVTTGLVSVIIPVYNEGDTIADVIERVRSVPGIKMELVVVDDGSEDNTWDALQHIPGIVALRHEKNQGKGAAIRTALPHTQGKAVIIQDADLEYDPDEIPDVVEPILAGRETVVYGSRFMTKRVPEGMKLPHWIANRMLAVTAKTLYGQNIHDVCTCYKAFDGDLIRSTPLECMRFEFCMEVTAKFKRKGITILEVPIAYKARSVQQGKKIRWWDTFIMLGSLIKFRFKK